MATRPKHPEAGSINPGDAGRESPLARWSRRKASARSETPPQTAPPPAAADTPPAPAAAKSEVTVPPIDKLDEHSDYSGFLSPEVSEELRRVALRKLFHLSRFNIIDGLDDYAEDYTVFTPLGNIITADMRHHMEREAEELKKRMLAEGEGGDAPPKAATGESADVAASTTEAAGVSAPTDQTGTPESAAAKVPDTGQKS